MSKTDEEKNPMRKVSYANIVDSLIYVLCIRY